MKDHSKSSDEGEKHEDDSGSQKANNKIFE